MGFVKSIFGGGGMGWSPDMTQVSDQQMNTAYDKANTGLDQQQAFLNALAAQNGVQNQANVFDQLQALANGQGPNPALAQLAQTTGQNVQNQAALMAGQRGSGANAGLMARQIGNQGANMQQQATGQAATMAAQQQLGALGQLGGLASQQVGQQQNALQALMGGTQGEQQLLGQQQYQRNALSQQQAQQVGLAQRGLLGGIMGAAGTAIGMADGGEVPGGPKSIAGSFMSGWNAGIGNDPLAMGTQQFSQGLGKGLGYLGDKIGHQINNMLGFQNTGMGGSDLMGQPITAPTMAASKGGKVPGQAAFGGDDYANDTVPAMLSPGEIVIPRSISKGDDAPEKAAAFVRAVRARHGMGKRK